VPYVAPIEPATDSGAPAGDLQVSRSIEYVERRQYYPIVGCAVGVSVANAPYVGGAIPTAPIESVAADPRNESANATATVEEAGTSICAHIRKRLLFVLVAEDKANALAERCERMLEAAEAMSAQMIQEAKMLLETAQSASEKLCIDARASAQAIAKDIIGEAAIVSADLVGEGKRISAGLVDSAARESKATVAQAGVILGKFELEVECASTQLVDKAAAALSLAVEDCKMANSDLVGKIKSAIEEHGKHALHSCCSRRARSFRAHEMFQIHGRCAQL
jgi:ethanolamine utilization microcompartment shell protein EutS